MGNEGTSMGLNGNRQGSILPAAKRLPIFASAGEYIFNTVVL